MTYQSLPGKGIEFIKTENPEMKVELIITHALHPLIPVYREPVKEASL